LAFTWRWDSEPAEAPTREVSIRFEPRAEGGSAITLTHGPYSDAAREDEVRAGHLEGWLHFLGRLQAAIRTTG
jgi:uncharacterized protein YndB with AHSA1/START domain